MKESLAVSLRILTCVENHTDPVQLDIKTLQSWVDPGEVANGVSA